jgi:transcriptional regulator with XRE-family HTH domain
MATDTPSRFTTRLRRLQNTHRPPGQDEPLTAGQIVRGVYEATGIRMSESSVRYLLSGERQPRLDTTDALARYFGVPTSYFTDDDVSGIEEDLEHFQKIRALKRLDVTTMAARLDGLSNAELLAMEAFIGRLLQLRHDDPDHRGDDKRR